MDITVLTVILVVAAVGGLLYERQKAKNLEALAQTQKTKDEVKEIDKEIDKNNADMKAEKEKLEEDKKKDVSKDDLLKFLNDPNK